MAHSIAKFVCFSTLPRFQHDCKCCKFLGTLETVPSGDMYDIYACNAGGEKSYLLRYGYRAHENRSIPASIVSMLPKEGDPYKLAEILEKRDRPPALYRVEC